jgi:aminopeptidase N
VLNSLSVMAKDSFESSHPVSQIVNYADELGAIFDEISYDKGASIIRMMNAFLTEPTFRKGVTVRDLNKSTLNV